MEEVKRHKWAMDEMTKEKSKWVTYQESKNIKK